MIDLHLPNESRRSNGMTVSREGGSTGSDANSSEGHEAHMRFEGHHGLSLFAKRGLLRLGLGSPRSVHHDKANIYISIRFLKGECIPVNGKRQVASNELSSGQRCVLLD